ncbi:MAG: hypothetical protein QOK25_1317 [Thermoleophilaceae bacterium]|jgi:hypothetical protein|nr:hypothetical protein [Thermoleophilaceae bacterium]
MAAQIAAVLAQFPSVPNPGQGSTGLQGLLNVFYVLLGLGFLLGVTGHVIKSRTLVIVGVTMIFAGTGAFLIAVSGNG